MLDLNLRKDLRSIRENFPVLKKCVYLISNSLGAVPVQVADNLKTFYELWADKGVSAWRDNWWDLSRRIGSELASLLGAEDDEITMMPNATVAHWVALSTQFSAQNGRRNKIVITDHDFPSTIYAVAEIAKVLGWTIDMVRSDGRYDIDIEEIISRIDDRVCFVATSHVYFKSGYIQHIGRIAQKADRVGAITLIDGYHAPGTIPVSLRDLNIGFYVGGCLKWLCGGPGNAFLYVNKDLSPTIQPSLTGWMAHRSPFSFSHEMEFTEGSYKFMSGTPSIPSLYTASAGLNVIKRIGISQIREKSRSQTQRIIDKSRERGFTVFSPESEKNRGGAVSLVLPHGYQIKQALEQRQIFVDYRQGQGREPDIIRVGPHFYTKDEEIDVLFTAIDEIFRSGEHKKFPEELKTVT